MAATAQRAALVDEVMDSVENFGGSLEDKVTALGMIGPDDVSLQMCLARLLTQNGWTCTPPRPACPKKAKRAA